MQRQSRGMGSRGSAQWGCTVLEAAVMRVSKKDATHRHSRALTTHAQGAQWVENEGKGAIKHEKWTGVPMGRKLEFGLGGGVCSMKWSGWNCLEHCRAQNQCRRGGTTASQQQLHRCYRPVLLRPPGWQASCHQLTPGPPQPWGPGRGGCQSHRSCGGRGSWPSPGGTGAGSPVTNKQGKGRQLGVCGGG